MHLKRLVGRFILFAFPACVLFGSCNDEEEKITPRHEVEQANVSPYPFRASVLKVGSDYAFIDWGPVSDEDNDLLSHTVFLGEDIVVQGLQTDSICKLTGLRPLTEYSGKIVVTDAISEPTVAAFSFTTKKHVTTFNRMFEGYNGRIPVPSSMAKTHDGGYVISGAINFNNDGRGHYLAKVDSLGFEQWHTMVEDHVWITDVGGGIVRQTSDNGFIVVSGDENILRFDEAGNLLWRVREALVASVIEAPNGDFLVLKSQGGLERYDSNGSLLWSKYYEQNEALAGNYLTESGDGNYVVLGTIRRTGYRDVTVAKIDGEGNLLWSNVYPNGMPADFPRQIELTNDGGFIIGATASGSLSSHARMMKLDADGNVAWDRAYQFRSRVTCNAIAQTPDGSYVFTGTNGDQPTEAILVKIDSKGELLWSKHYMPEMFLDYHWNGHDLQVAADGGFTVVGFKTAIWGILPDMEIGMWLFKTDDAGEFE